MKKFDYYTKPSQEVFDDIKENATKIWNTYSDEFGYRSEKLNRIRGMENVSDNAWYMVAMFDYINQAKLLTMVKPETAKIIQQALKGSE
jgi:hypothetical protein